MRAFMPGSLAAPNKIVDFQSYIGREVIVMVEDFLREIDSFIVSHKKYLAHVLPTRIRELDLSKKYAGTVTGCSKYGTFVEFEEIFTGLLHMSKMDAETRSQFDVRSIKPGDAIEFYISEITKDNRIILTKENPEDKLNKIQGFIVESKDRVLESTIVATLGFGIIVSFGNDITGLVPVREFKRNRITISKLTVGDKIRVLFDEYRDERLIFRLPG